MISGNHMVAPKTRTNTGLSSPDEGFVGAGAVVAPVNVYIIIFVL